VLTEAQRQALVELARRSVVAKVTGGAPVASSFEDLPAAEGVFVTLKHRGQLRGCLGTLDCRGDLENEVARCAADAATVDPRFPAIAASELHELSIEVSVLGPLERINPAEPGAVTIGRHGLVVEQGRRRGVLLPQVASEWRWTVEQFVRQTCRKADLAEDAWQRGAVVYRFDAEVFGEI
jgi:AmmeMemoRadiSam system protein A